MIVKLSQVEWKKYKNIEEMMSDKDEPVDVPDTFEQDIAPFVEPKEEDPWAHWIDTSQGPQKPIQDTHQLKDESWQDPAIQKEKSPEQLVSEEWSKGMIRVGPEVYVDSNTIDILLAAKGLGFNVSSKKDIYDVLALRWDDSPLRDIEWFTDEEFGHLVQYLVKTTPMPKSSQVLLAQEWVEMAVDLLSSLYDMGYKIDMTHYIADTINIMDKLASNGGPFAKLAIEIKEVLKSPDQFKRQQLIGAYTADMMGKPEHTPPNKNVYGPEIDEYGRPVYQMLEDEGTGRKTKELVTRQYTVPWNAEGADAEPWKELAKERQKNWELKHPGILPPKQEDDDEVKPEKQKKEVKEFTQYSTALPAEPTPAVMADKGGATAMGKQAKDFVNRYDDIASGVPGVFMADMKEVIARVDSSGKPKNVMIYDVDGNARNERVYGGMVVHHRETGRIGMVIGQTENGNLAVRVLPTGEAEEWDIEAGKIRRGRNQYVQP